MLPSNYDRPGASRRIDELIAENMALPVPGVMFPSEWTKFHTDDSPDLSCVPFGSPVTYRLAKRDTEIVFRMIGVADEYYLPPFDRFRLQSTRIQFVQQAVSLNGLSATMCAGDMDALHDIFETASRLAPITVDNTWTISPEYRVRFSNRLLVPKENAEDGSICTITNDMDPAGTLRAKAEAAGLVHTDDNLVEYLRVTCDNKFYKISPSSVRKGDIVEIRFSVGLFGSSRSTLFLRLILRAIISMDTSFTRNSARLLTLSKLNTRDGRSDVRLKRRRILGDRTNEPSQQVPRIGIRSETQTDQQTVSCIETESTSVTSEDAMFKEFLVDNDIVMKEEVVSDFGSAFAVAFEDETTGTQGRSWTM